MSRASSSADQHMMLQSLRDESHQLDAGVRTSMERSMRAPFGDVVIHMGPAIADEAQRKNVGVLAATTTPSAWPGTSRLAQGHSAVKTALGLHPQLAHQRRHEIGLFEEYLPDTRFVGEVGLDASPELRGFWHEQVEVFQHVLRACEVAGNKIVSIHSRRAATGARFRTALEDGVDLFQRGGRPRTDQHVCPLTAEFVSRR